MDGRARTLSLVSLSLLVTSVFSSQAGFCQNGNKATLPEQLNRSKLNQKPAWQVTGESLAKPPSTLKDKVSLEGIPEYTGKSKFVNGLVYEKVGKQGANYVMTFNVKETKSQVKDWYQGVFQMYKWNITHNDADSLMAFDKNRNSCIIQISEPVPGVNARDDRSSYTIRYQYSKPQ